MDAFYASVELLRYPELRGRPVVVGGRRTDPPAIGDDGLRRFARLKDYVGRGVATTSTYEARALGVFSAMGLMKAARLAPEAVLLPADFDAYRHYSRRFKAAVAAIAPCIEDHGIDEIYVDLTELPDDSPSLGRWIKRAIREATGLTCSIGITPNKLLSKIASDLDKPDGLTILGMEDVSARIWPLAVSKINGIGPKATERLAAMGIASIGELARTEPAVLQDAFGRSYSLWLSRVAHGEDERPVVTHSEPKSLSRETTFERDLHARDDRPALSSIFTDLCERLATDLVRRGYLARHIGIKLRFEDFQTVTRDITLPEPIASADAIRHAAGLCLKRVPLDRRLRLLGVRAAGLRPASEAAASPTPSPQEELPFGDPD